MAVTRIELDLDNQEYSWIVNSLQEHEQEVRSRLQELDHQGIDHSGLSQEADAVAELIEKIETASDQKPEDKDLLYKPNAFDSEEEWRFYRLRETTQRADALLAEGTETVIDPTKDEHRAYLSDLAGLLNVVAERLSDMDIRWSDFSQQADEADRSGLYREPREFLERVLTATLDPEYLQATKMVRQRLEQVTRHQAMHHQTMYAHS